MTGDEKSLGGRACRVYAQRDAQFVLVQPVDDHDLAGMDREAEIICASAPSPFVLAAVPVRDWFCDLSPWSAPPVFGREAFGDGAKDTLTFLQQRLLPELKAAYDPRPEALFILGGYSLAGLFSLWCGHETDAFYSIAAASPSVWFPGFLDWAGQRPMRARRVYLSLGDREEKARNPVMAQVGDCIRSLHAQYQRQGLDTALIWNPGNHFQHAEERTAQAFLWAMKK